MRELRRRIADYRMPTRTRVIVTLLFVAITAVGTTLSSFDAAVTAPPIDYDVFGQPGADILTLQWGRVFTDPILQAGPYELIFWGIPKLLGVSGYLGWGLFYTVMGALIAIALAWVVFRLVRPIAPDTAAPIAAAVSAFAAVSDSIVLTVESGHPAESVVPILWIVAALLARRGHAFWAAAVLGSTLGWELWGILGAPVLLLAPRIRLRTVLVSAAGGIGALLVTFGGFVLAGPVTMFGYEWVVHDESLIHTLLPDVETFSWSLRLGQAALSVGAGIVVAWFLRGLRDAVWLVPLAVTSVRLLTDPIVAGYYFCAAIVLALAGLALGFGFRSLTRIVAALLLLNAMIDFQGTGWAGPAIMVVVTAVTVVVLARGRPAQLRREQTAPDSGAADAPVPATTRD